jgi:tRNA uridine 5-carboxymethylaminomethyl modification enzyme
VENGVVVGVRTVTDTVYNCRAVVVATGTFLGGRIILGEKILCQRAEWSAPCPGFLTKSLERLGLELGRFKNRYSCSRSSAFSRFQQNLNSTGG